MTTKLHDHDQATPEAGSRAPWPDDEAPARAGAVYRAEQPRGSASWLDGEMEGRGAFPPPGQRWLDATRERRQIESRLRMSAVVAGVLIAGALVVRTIGAGHGDGAAGQALPQATRAAARQPAATVQGTAPATPAAGVAQGAATPPASATVAGQPAIAAGQRADAPGATPVVATAALAATPVVGTGALAATPRPAGAAATPAGQVRGSDAGVATTPRAGASPVADPTPAATPAASTAGARPAATPLATSAPSGPQRGAPPATTPAAVSTAATGQRTYTVQSGDTLYAIALSNHTTVDALVAANDLKTADSILAIGQKLALP